MLEQMRQLISSAALLPRMARPYALLVGGELLSRITDMDDRSTCIIFGDGVGAAVVKADPDAPWFARLGARGCREVLWAPGPGQAEHPYLHMNGQEVFKFALETVPKLARELLDQAGLDKDQVDWYVPHQANHRIVESVAKRLKVPLDRFYENIERYGNTSAGTIPIALDEMAERGLLKPGQWIMCLGFGAGLAVFMFTGFVKSLPLEIEEAAAIDGCGPLRTYFSVVLPMLRPTMISVGILEIMWVWNDYLLPYLVLDRTKYLTIPIHIQYLKGSYGTVDLGATMALILLSIIPVIVFYLLCQKYIIKGVAAGAVKG